ncbi:MAG TPA: ABC transporter C-terminal domain-containing protein, partial [Thermoanaerobaculia bacterium]|nr:ABC transporter C-terminal domain-containing protein [Thermoanaerobaculia bacterium]
MRCHSVPRGCAPRWTFLVAASAVFLALLAAPSIAQSAAADPPSASAPGTSTPAPTTADDLRRELAALKADSERRIADLEKRLAELEAAKAGEVPAAPAAEATPPPATPEAAAPAASAADLAAAADILAAGTAEAAPPSPAPLTIVSGAGGKNFLNLSLDGLIAAGSSTSKDIAALQTGGHDPIQRGFTVQNVEAVFDGAVDPYFRGQANVVLQIDDKGQSTVELEEAYATTTSLPAGLQLKAGQFFTEFGRLNPTHPHTWDFVD